jgi:hypothetical protein
MTKAISYRLAAAGILAAALSIGPAGATVKPAPLRALPDSIVLAQQQQSEPQAEDQKPQKKQAKKKKMSREEDAKAKARKYLPPEYHQYIPR